MNDDKVQEHSPITVRLPKFDPKVITYRQRLIDAAGRPDKQSGHQLFWCAPTKSQVAGILRCTAPAGPFVLGLNHWSSLTPEFPEGFGHLPPAVRLEIAAASIAPVLDRLGEFLGEPIKVHAWEGGHVALTDTLADLHGTDSVMSIKHLHLGFEIRDAQQDLFLTGQVLGAELYPVSFGQPVAALPLLSSSWLGDVPISLPIEMGRVSLRLSDVRGAECGDVIRLDAPANIGVPVAVFVPFYSDRPGGLQCRLAGRTLLVESIVNTSIEAQVSTDELLTPEPDISIDPADIRCTMVAELGRLQLSVQALSSLKIGQSLMLPGRAAEVAVSLKVSGQQIGRGELIAVGDELAVMVTELGPVHEAQPANG